MASGVSGSSATGSGSTTARGLLCRYTPFAFGSAVWAELSVQHERQEIELLAGHLESGAVFVDVGWHSIRLARVVEGLRVIAFEPVPETFATLRANVARNGVQVEANPCALGDSEGTVLMSAGLQLGNFVLPEGSVPRPLPRPRSKSAGRRRARGC